MSESVETGVHASCKGGYCDHCDFPVNRCLCHPRCSQASTQERATALLANIDQVADQVEPVETTEFGLSLSLTVEVPSDLVPAEWAEDGPPRRLYSWPEALRKALQAAMVAQIAEEGAPDYDEATWVPENGEYHDPSTN